MNGKNLQKVFFSNFKNFIKSILGVRVYKIETLKPSAEELSDFLSKEISIYTELESNITYISINTENPEMGKNLLNILNESTDNFLKERVYRKSLVNIQSIKKQISETTNADHKKILFEKLAVEETMKLSASSDLPYSAEIFGEIYSSNRPTKPRASFVLFSFFLFGVLFNVIF